MVSAISDKPKNFGSRAERPAFPFRPAFQSVLDLRFPVVDFLDLGYQDFHRCECQLRERFDALFCLVAALCGLTSSTTNPPVTPIVPMIRRRQRPAPPVQTAQTGPGMSAFWPRADIHDCSRHVKLVTHLDQRPHERFEALAVVFAHPPNAKLSHRPHDLGCDIIRAFYRGVVTD